MKKIFVNALAALALLANAACQGGQGEAPATDSTAKDSIAAEPVSTLIEKEVEYTDGSTTYKGFLAYDGAKEGKRPGVLVVHEWWGLNDYSRERARMLAQEGYVALALDMYGDGKLAGHPEEAGAFSQAVFANLDSMKIRFEAAQKFLAEQEQTQTDQIAAFGYCFGGGVVLHMARAGAELDAVVSFHGSLGTQTPAKPGQVKARVMVCNGADDSFVPAEQITAFKAEMDAAKVDYQFHNYPGAIHSFTSPAADSLGKLFELPLAYNQQADEQSWSQALELLRQSFSAQ